MDYVRTKSKFLGNIKKKKPLISISPRKYQLLVTNLGEDGLIFCGFIKTGMLKTLKKKPPQTSNKLIVFVTESIYSGFFFFFFCCDENC